MWTIEGNSVLFEMWQVDSRQTCRVMKVAPFFQRFFCSDYEVNIGKAEEQEEKLFNHV